MGLVNGNIDTAAPPPTVGCPSEGTAATAAIASASGDSTRWRHTTASRPHRAPVAPIREQASSADSFCHRPHTKLRLGSFLITGTDLTLGRARRCECGLGFPDGEFAYGRRSGCTSQRDSGQRSAGQERLLAGWQRGDDQSGGRRHDGRHDHRGSRELRSPRRAMRR